MSGNDDFFETFGLNQNWLCRESRVAEVKGRFAKFISVKCCLYLFIADIARRDEAQDLV